MGKISFIIFLIPFPREVILLIFIIGKEAWILAVLISPMPNL